MKLELGLGLYNPAPPAGAPPFVNQYSLLLDGTNDHATTSFDHEDYDGAGNSLREPGFTISGWVKVGTFQSGLMIGTYGSGASNRMAVGFSGTSNYHVAIGNYNHTTVAHGLSTGTWYHLCLTFTGFDDDNTFVLYRNASSVHTGTVAAWTGTARTLTIGAVHYVWPHLYYFNGNIDEVGIWNEPLTSAEVTALYNGGDPVALDAASGDYTSQSNLQAYWRFEEGSGTSIADTTGNGHTATLVNGPTFDNGDVPSS